jgi:hypothetical protein
MNDHSDLEFWDFPELKRRKIVGSRAQLYRYNFPKGVLLSPNCRRWTPQQIREWLATRPTRKPPRPASTSPSRPALLAPDEVARCTLAPEPASRAAKRTKVGAP